MKRARGRIAWGGCADVCPILIALSVGLAGCGARTSLEVFEEAGEAAPPPPPPRPRFACAYAADPRPMLAARIDGAVHFVYPDRSTREVFTLGIPEDGYVVGAGLAARGDRVAAYAIITPSGGRDTFPPFVEVVLLDVDGTVRFTEQRPFGYEGWGSDSVIVGHPDGRFVLTLREIQVSLGLVFGDEGATPFDGPWAARSDPDARGRLIVNDYEGSSSAAYHWLDATTGEAWPTAYWTASERGVAASSAAVVDDGVAYFARSPSRLVWERVDGAIELPVGDALGPDDYAGTGWQRSGGWVLFSMRDAAPFVYVVAQPATRTLRELTLTHPTGWQGPADTWNPPMVDGTGRVVQILSDGPRLQVFATSDGDAWTPLGQPLTAASYPTLIEAGGAVVFDGRGGGPEPVDGALPSYAAQLIGPQGGEGTVLERWSGPGAPSNPTYGDDALSGDGRCLAHFRDGAVRIVESADYATSDVPLLSTTQSAELAWIPLAE